MKIYVASKFENKVAVREAMFKLVEAGHTITYDWTISSESSLYEAIRDRRGVLEADILIGLFDKPYNYQGALIELGIAIAKDMPIYIIGNQLDNVIFMQLLNIHPVENVEQVISWLSKPQIEASPNANEF